jgi:hypothetical protein
MRSPSVAINDALIKCMYKPHDCEKYDKLKKEIYVIPVMIFLDLAPDCSL